MGGLTGGSFTAWAKNGYDVVGRFLRFRRFDIVFLVSVAVAVLVVFVFAVMMHTHAWKLAPVPFFTIPNGCA